MQVFSTLTFVRIENSRTFIFTHIRDARAGDILFDMATTKPGPTIIEVRLSEGICPLHGQEHLGEQGFCAFCGATWSLKRGTVKVTMRHEGDMVVESSIEWDRRDLVRLYDPDKALWAALLSLADTNSRIKMNPAWLDEA